VTPPPIKQPAAVLGTAHDSDHPSRFLEGDAARAEHRGATRDIVAMTWPVVLGQLMANAVPLIDIFMLGSLGTPTLAAVGYASQFLMLAQASLMAIGSACVAMMARAIGAGQDAQARRAFGACLWLSIGITLPFAALTLLFPHALLQVLDVQEAVIDLAVPYFRLTLASSLPMAIALTYEHAFRAGKDTFGPMMIASFVSVLKVACNYVLIFGHAGLPQLGLLGAGVATVVSQCVAAGLFLWASARHSHPAVRMSTRDLKRDAVAIREALWVALPAVGERFVMNVAMMCYFRFLGGYGVHAIAAYNVGVRILAFTWIPGLGLSVAAATLVGHALGAGDPVLARRSGWQATRIGLAIAAVLGALFIALRVPMAKVFTDDPAVVADLDPFILLLGIALPFLVTHFTLGGALRGAGDTMTPLKAAALGNWAFRVPLGYVFGQVLHLALPWVWAIMLIDHFARAVWLLWSFHFGHWHRSLGAALQTDVEDEPVASAG
jgi:putative MATE family efflux protein